MDMQEIMCQFEALGFAVQRPIQGAGLVVANHRLNSRLFLTFQEDRDAIAAHGEHELGTLMDQFQEAERFELLFAKIGYGLWAVTVRAKIHEPSEVQALYPKLRALLDALSRIGETST